MKNQKIRSKLYLELFKRKKSFLCYFAIKNEAYFLLTEHFLLKIKHASYTILYC